MISLLHAFQRSLAVALMGLVLLSAGCALESEETGAPSTPALTDAAATDDAATDDAVDAESAVPEAEDNSAGAGDPAVGGATSAVVTETQAGSEDPPPSLPLLQIPDIPRAGESVEVTEESVWLTDYALAREQAAAGNKTILMNFTGSDWCGWCIRLRGEVFELPEFLEYAEKNLVLLELDFPRGKSLSPELMAQNSGLEEQFGVEGFPTILLVDDQGRPFAKTGYQEGGATAYVSHLTDLLEVRSIRDKALAAAEQSEGPERAKHLDAAISALPEDVVFPVYEPVVNEIIELDVQDKAGLKTRYGNLILGQKVTARLADVENLLRSSDDLDEVLKTFKELETEFSGYQDGLIQVRLLKGRVLSAFGKHEEALALADELGQIKELTDEDRFMVLGIRVMANDELGRPEKSLEAIDAAVEVFSEPRTVMQLYLTKAQLLVKMESVLRWFRGKFILRLSLQI